VINAMNKPKNITNKEYQFDEFDNGRVLHSKKKNHLPAMGWNSWNAFGSGNTEELTRIMAEKFIELELDKCGYEYIVLDDGCYYPKRIDGLLSNEDDKFPSGFSALSEFIHSKGLKFGMYNDIGTKLCSGLEVGTCGYEKEDAREYVKWGIDFIKIDNCYYLWDNATFSDASNAKYTYAPNIKSIRLSNDKTRINRNALWDAEIVGKGAYIQNDHITMIGTFDGTGPDSSPIGLLSGEVVFEIEIKEKGIFSLEVEYEAGEEIGKGSWIQIAVDTGEESKLIFDDMLPIKEGFSYCEPIEIELKKGFHQIRIMNHRRQENTLMSYATFLEALNEADPDHDILISLCEWGKTHPQNWGYKVGDSWRILNDITFQVGSDSDPGQAAWESDYTTSITSQYNKAVIMDEFAGLKKGWNDPDMLMIGMNGLDETMNRSHMSLWCMMNSPLMLGMDLRRISKGDIYYNIITNTDIIALNQDELGIQAKRVYSSLETINPDKVYIRDNNRYDILAKPCSDGGVAIAFVNLSGENITKTIAIDINTIISFIGHKMVDADSFIKAKSYIVKDLWTKAEKTINSEIVEIDMLGAHACEVFKIYGMY